MENLDILIRVGAIAVALILLLGNINLSKYTTYVTNLFKRSTPKVSVVDNTNNHEDDFLEIINLWFKLKEKCQAYKLDFAVDKLDEVFPLLNAEK